MALDTTHTSRCASSIAVAILGAVLLAGCAGTASEPPASPSPSLLAWETYAPRGAGFTVELPGPKEVTTGEAADGPWKGRVTQADVATPDGCFEVAWWTGLLPESSFDPDEWVSTLASGTGTAVSQGPEEVGGQRGYAALVTANGPLGLCPESGPMRVTAKTVVVGDRRYEITTIVPDPPGMNATATRFLESFQLVP